MRGYEQWLVRDVREHAKNDATVLLVLSDVHLRLLRSQVLQGAKLSQGDDLASNGCDNLSLLLDGTVLTQQDDHLRGCESHRLYPSKYLEC